jgi:two-component system, OmpR family, sensor histidine kinase MtrB
VADDLASRPARSSEAAPPRAVLPDRLHLDREPRTAGGRVTRGTRSTTAFVRRTAHRVASAWRRSLQFRVGFATLLVTIVVVVVIGVFLDDKVTGGVLRAKRDAAVNQARVSQNIAKSTLTSSDANSYSEVATAQSLLATTLAVGNSGGNVGTSTAGSFDIVLVGSATRPTTLDQIPDTLRSVVRRGHIAVQYAPVPKPGDTGDAQVKGLVVGEPIRTSSGLFELYFRFPLTTEQQTIALIQRTVWFAGLALVILVLGITLLVTRVVVRPVRVAAETAGQLAAGDLSQRITVRGTDDIARLGQSFNDMADSLQRQIRRLEDLSRLQQRFTSDVSHELRTPLTTIRMAAALLHGNRDEFAPEIARTTELLDTELDRFESLLGDLLEISRYDAGVARLESETSDIRGVVSAAVEDNRVLASRHGSEMVVALPDHPVTVDMDARRVERILRNLLGNALDHGEGNPVEVTVGFDDDAVAVSVRDHGVGLRPGQAALVFNRFWRGDASRSRLTGGTGLGLAISLEDARLHDGWLQAWGEPGHGARFRLTLPRRAGHTLMSSPLPLHPDDEDEEDEDE